jgi:hypothetical protein
MAAILWLTVGIVYVTTLLWLRMVAILWWSIMAAILWLTVGIVYVAGLLWWSIKSIMWVNVSSVDVGTMLWLNVTAILCRRTAIIIWRRRSDTTLIAVGSSAGYYTWAADQNKQTHTHTLLNILACHKTGEMKGRMVCVWPTRR